MADERRGNGGDQPAVVFDYIKSPHFRVVRADGAIGSITPNRHIHFALYSERLAIPRQIVNKINEDGTLGDEIPERRVAREGIVREMEIDIFLTVDVAKQLCDWLSKRISEIGSQQTGPQRSEEEH